MTGDWASWALPISIHALREERDFIFCRVNPVWKYFNPRAPRGARPCEGKSLTVSWNFNPRAPRGARRGIVPFRQTLFQISIHALREERDFSFHWNWNSRFLFQSTRSARSATDVISGRINKQRDFNPRAPR